LACFVLAQRMRNLAARLRNSRVVKIAFSRPLLHSTVRVSDVDKYQKHQNDKC